MFGGPSGRLPTNAASSHNFAQIPQANVPRSAFDRSSKYSTTCQASGLVPIFVDEVIPGDTFNLNSTIFARLLTPLVPAMDQLVLDTQFFFVPNRLVWTNWEKFCGAQTNPGDSISYTIPQMGPAFSYAAMTIYDYMIGPITAYNVGGTAGYLSALPFRAYNKIYNDWYRDENIQNSIATNTGDGPDASTDYTLRNRGRRKDYFWGSLTSAQKGTAVPFLTGTANVYGPTVTDTTGQAAWQLWNNTDAARQRGALSKTAGALTTTLAGFTGLAAGDDADALQLGNAADYTSLGSGYSPPYADLSTNVTDVVNTLRTAFQIQKFLERDARGGTRYTELILSHFGVVNPDFRLQRSEYLGGGSGEINIMPIPQTTPTGIAGTTTKFGDLAAVGTSISRHGFTHSFTEHGHIIGLMNIRTKAEVYMQGINRMWSRQTRYDFYWPVFAHLGEQTVLRKELYYVGDKAGANTDDTIFGYQERYGEYRYKPSMVTGLFASSLNYWHFGTIFTGAPALDSTNITDNTINNLDRNLGVTHSATVPQFKVDIFHKLHCARRMPVFGVPGNIDRF